jgi:glycosyltransferase involved in cell wall biosynthesis
VTRVSNGLRVLFLSSLDANTASFRFRVLKLLPYLEAAGLDVSVLRIKPGKRGLIHTGRVASTLLRGRYRRQLVIFQKTMSPGLAVLAHKLGARVAMDLDDGPTHHIDGTPHSPAALARWQSWLSTLDGVIVSSEALREAIREWNPNVEVIPTCVDSDNYAGIHRRNRDVPVVAWIGSGPSDIFLSIVAPALEELARKTRLRLLVVGNRKPSLSLTFDMSFQPWSLELEPRIFADMDIGIMPLPDNDRALMKAGFKLLQYWAAGLPVVASPIGINRELVRSGWNGFLAEGTDAWLRHLSSLLDDAELRHRLGAAGRAFVRENYDVRRAASRLSRTCEQFVRSG